MRYKPPTEVSVTEINGKLDPASREGAEEWVNRELMRIEFRAMREAAKWQARLDASRRRIQPSMPYPM